MPSPNFLIIGAAKSATSSLHEYLRQHPEVAMSVCKEPHFYSRRVTGGHPLEYYTQESSDPFSSSQNSGCRLTLNQQNYEKLFTHVREEKAIGESSVSYLATPGVAELIRSEWPQMKLVVLLRNPIERAYSAYLNMRRVGVEQLPFQEALKQEEKRKSEKALFMLQYREMGNYYQQLKPYRRCFPPNQLLVVTYDDWVKDKKCFFRQLFRFLEVDEHFQVDTRFDYNRSGTPRSQRLHDWIIKPNRWRRAIGKWMPGEIRWRLRKLVRDANLTPKTPMPVESYNELRESYLPEIERLEGLLDWDLSHWKAPKQ